MPRRFSQLLDFNGVELSLDMSEPLINPFEESFVGDDDISSTAVENDLASFLGPGLRAPA